MLNSEAEHVSPEAEEEKKLERGRAQDDGQDWVHYQIDRNCCLEVQDGPDSQRSGPTGRQRRERSQRSQVLGRIPTSAKSQPGVRNNPEAVGACFPLIIPELGNTWPEVEDPGS